MKTFRCSLALAAIAVMFGLFFTEANRANAFSAQKKFVSEIAIGVTAPTGIEPAVVTAPSLTPSLPNVTPAPVPQPVQPVVIVPAQPVTPAVPAAQPATPK